MRKRAIPAALALFAFALPASAYTFLGFTWSYQATPIDRPFSLNLDSFQIMAVPPQDVEAAFVSALDTWSLGAANDGINLQLAYGGTTTSTLSADIWADDELVTQAVPYLPGPTLAVTAWFATTRIEDCDTLVAGSNALGPNSWEADPAGPSPSGFDLESVLLHELGHCLGLNHSALNTVMYETLSRGDMVRVPAADDLAGLEVLYGLFGPPTLAVNALYILDDDGDGFNEPGEAIGLRIDVDNGSDYPAVAATITADTSDPRVTVVDATALPLFDPDHAAMSVQVYDGIVLSVVSNCGGSAPIDLSLDLAAEGVVINTEMVQVPLDCPVDTDGDWVTDALDLCEGFDDANDLDADGVPDGCDVCDGDDFADDDSDDVPDACDACPGADDSLDDDGDGVADGCDLCVGSDDTLDADADGVADGCDVCEGHADDDDADADGVPDGCDPCPDDSEATDSDGDGSWSCEDCDDTNPNTLPGAEEIADGRDNDCDGVVDEGTKAGDDDGDGFTELQGDCDDADPLVSPGAEDLTVNGVDENCDDVDGIVPEVEEEEEDLERDPPDACGCSTSSGPSGGALWLGLILAFGARRRSVGISL